uniref:Protein prenyltransferase alpha subunit repeat-containing protein 1 n=1 Tax=Strigamia maritima TaxID=126957 RepID=T1JIA4_STRMM
MELDALAERILTDLCAVFKRDPFVHEFDLVAVVEAQNKSPVLHIGHKLALESWCVKHLYHHSYNKLFDWKEKKRKIVPDPEKLIRWTTAVLLLNPDVATAWNVRKEMILNANLDCKHELTFAHAVLTRKPKSPEKMVVVVFNGQQINILAKELATSEEWVSTHVSDHSGIQYRQYLIEQLIEIEIEIENENETRKTSAQSRNNSQLLNAANLLGKEMEFSTELICLYPGHEALWYHRRFVVYMCNKFGLLSGDHLSSVSVKSSSLHKKSKLENNTCGFALLTLEKELSFLEQCAIQFRENLIQLSNANNYRKWLTSGLSGTL